MEAAPLLGITNYLKLPREEKNELKFVEKVHYGEYPLEYYENAEIPESEAIDTDYAVRSMEEGETETAYYRFNKSIGEHGRNMMRAAYAYKYGNPEKTPWRNYLDARPATVGHIIKYNKSFSGTRGFGDFEKDEYD